MINRDDATCFDGEPYIAWRDYYEEILHVSQLEFRFKLVGEAIQVLRDKRNISFTEADQLISNLHRLIDSPDMRPLLFGSGTDKTLDATQHPAVIEYATKHGISPKEANRIILQQLSDMNEERTRRAR